MSMFCAACGALAQCAICGGDGLCDACGGLGFVMAKSYDGDEMIQIACMEAHCEQGRCRACAGEPAQDGEALEIQEMLDRADAAYEAGDYETALALYMDAAECGSAEAICEIGIMHQFGIGTDQNEEEAFKWFEKAAKLGHAEAMCSLGMLYRDGMGISKDQREAFKWFERGADLGHALSAHCLGVLYQTGSGVEKDYGKAKELFELSVSLGDVGAMNSIASLYYLGMGVEQDYRKAFEFYEKAALAGDGSAMRNMAGMYKTGKGVEQDLEKAYEWYSKAAQEGDPTGKAEMLVLQAQGYGAAQQKEEETAEATDGQESAAQNAPIHISLEDMEDYLLASLSDKLDGLDSRNSFRDTSNNAMLMYDCRDGQTLVHFCYVMLHTSLEPEQWGDPADMQLFLDTVLEALAAGGEEQRALHSDKQPFDDALGGRLSMGGTHTQEIIKDFDGVSFPVLGSWKVSDSMDALLFGCYDMKTGDFMEDNRYLFIRYRLPDGTISCHIETDQQIIAIYMKTAMGMKTTETKEVETKKVELQADAGLQMQVRVRDGSTINVREKDSADSRFIGVAQGGTVYTCLSVADNGWCQIVLEEGMVGYVSGNLVSIVQ